MLGEGLLTPPPGGDRRSPICIIGLPPETIGDLRSNRGTGRETLCQQWCAVRQRTLKRTLEEHQYFASGPQRTKADQAGSTMTSGISRVRTEIVNGWLARNGPSADVNGSVRLHRVVGRRSDYWSWLRLRRRHSPLVGVGRDEPGMDPHEDARLWSHRGGFRVGCDALAGLGGEIEPG